MGLKTFIARSLKKNGKTDFLSRLNRDVHILDVGCGNNSPHRVKKVLPACVYTGLDIVADNNPKPSVANEFILTTPNKFHIAIDNFHEHFDAVISSHNLEHCDDREAVLRAMLKSLKRGGELFISFPSEESTTFPSRRGTLNYADDPTHLGSPPNFRDLIKQLKENGFSIVFSQKNYSPIILRICGFLVEPVSRVRGKVMMGTWEYYGFESIIIARKG